MADDMGGVVLHHDGGALTTFAPADTLVKLAELDGDIVKWRALGDWPALEQAVDDKIAEQAAFVAHWDKVVRSAGQPNIVAQSIVALGQQYSVKEAVERWGFRKDTVSRWRKSLGDVALYRAKLIIGTRRAAGLDPEGNHRAEGTGENEWFTPPQYIAAARTVMGGIDLDPATHPEAQATVQADAFFTQDDDGLSKDWWGRVWLNPPYAQPLIEQFVTKLVAEVEAGCVDQAILLTHNYTDTKWFHIAERACTAICFTRGRIKFTDIDGADCAPTQGQAFFYFGRQRYDFASTFDPHYGFVVEPHDGQIR